MKKRLALLSLFAIFALTGCSLLPQLPTRNSSNQISENDDSFDHSHHFGEWMMVLAPSCTENGREERKCNDCGYIESRVVKTNGHDWSNWQIEVEPTCEVDGTQYRHCYRCNTMERASLPAYGHDFIDIPIENDPNYIEPTPYSPGQRSRQCTRCSALEIYEIPTLQLEHNFVEVTNRVDEGTPKTLYMQCTDCGVCALEWDAQEFNQELTTGLVDVRNMNDGGMGIRFGAVQFSNGSLSDAGTHIVYKIYSPFRIVGVGLSFRIQVHASAPGYKIFDNYEIDSNFGYDYNDQGELVQSTKRYGFKVNNRKVELGDDYTEGLYSANQIAWIDWPVSFVLEKGLNTLEFYGLGGYRPIISHFQINGFGPELLNDAGSQGGHVHSFSNWVVVKSPTCTETGEERCTCQCGEFVSRELEPLGHNFVDHRFLAVIDLATTNTYLCANCNKVFERWSALDYDKNASINVDDASTEYLRFTNVQQYKNQNADEPGSHIVYNIYCDSTRSAQLSFHITTSPGSVVPIFDSVESDPNKGYEMDGQGNFIAATKRYGLIVNGEKIALGDDPYGPQAQNTNGWFDWPANFNLLKGKNTIEIYSLGGYRARFYEFQVIYDAPMLVTDGFNEPSGFYYGIYNDNGVSLPVSIEFGVLNNIGRLRIGNQEESFSLAIYISMTGEMELHSTNYGTFNCYFDHSQDRLYIGNLNGILNTELVLTNNCKYWNLDDSTEELQDQWNRRYGSPWTLDTNNADRVTQNTEHFVFGSAMRLRPYTDDRIALAAKDFSKPFSAKNISFWVYNSGENDASIQGFVYKSTNYNNFVQILANKTIKAGEWTFISCGFNPVDIYSFQIFVAQTSSALIFDDIVLL